MRSDGPVQSNTFTAAMRVGLLTVALSCRV